MMEAATLGLAEGQDVSQIAAWDVRVLKMSGNFVTINWLAAYQGGENPPPEGRAPQMLSSKSDLECRRESGSSQ